MIEATCVVVVTVCLVILASTCFYYGTDDGNPMCIIFGVIIFVGALLVLGGVI